MLESFQKTSRSAFGNGADVFQDLVMGHANAVVTDLESLLDGIRFEMNLEFRVVTQNARLSFGLIPNFVDGIRCV